MLKIFLYGIATFLETAIGIGIFGQMFPRRVCMEKKHYAASWALYTFLMVTACTWLRYFRNADKMKEYLPGLAAIYLSGIIMMWIFRKREGDNYKIYENSICIILFLGIILSITAQYWAAYQSTLMIALGNFVPAIFLYIYYGCSLRQAYIWEVLYLVNIGLMKEVYVAYVGTFQNRNFQDFMDYPRYHTYSEIIYILAIYILIYSLNKNISIGRLLKKAFEEYKVYLVIIAFVELYILRMLMHFGAGEIKESHLTSTLIISIIIILGLLFACIWIQQKISIAEKKIHSVQYETMVQQYEELKDAYERYRCLIHDEKHMIIYVQECLKNNNREEAMRFLGDYQHTIAGHSKTTWTGISVIDFMLNIKAGKMNEEKIKFHFQAKIETIPMEDPDMIMMLGNLLDNAIEAAEKCEVGKRNIFCCIQNINEMFLMQIKNSSTSKPKRIGERFYTNKIERERHGWGIESVRNIVKKYNGDIKFKYDETSFSVSIIIANI